MIETGKDLLAQDCCSTDEAQNCCSDQSTNSCCEPSVSSNCCEPNDAQCCESPASQNSNNGLGLVALFLAMFVLGNYFLNDFLVSSFSGLNDKVAGSLAFFISHSIGLLGILGSITTIAVLIRSFINEDKVRTHMSKINNVTGHGLAAGIGVATPFCSCSAVPVFTGFVRSGVPVSQAISFLVASPLVNEIAIGLLATWVGWKIAGVYAIAGFLIAVISGLLLKRVATPELTEVKPAISTLLMAGSSGSTKPTFAARLSAATAEASELVQTTWAYVLVGVGVGALLHEWLPQTAVETVASYGPVVGVIAATLLGVPLYSGIATVIPIVSVLADKGMPLGTLLAFAMSVTALSLPEAMLLRKVMKPKLLAMYFSTVAIGIMLVGIAFNLVLGH
jgi:uncharacterized membrane protein YraQ (UPF0718 family)